MKRVISAKDTFFYKIILPVFFLICAAVLPPAIYLYDRNGNFVAAVFVFLFLLMSAAIIFVMTKATKKLSLDGNFLYVSNYRKEIIVPLSNIEKILWFSDMRPTMIYLKTPSEFGKKINFFPNVKATSWKSNPIVEELKELAKIKNDESAV
ncbi:MAG: hypothetical protein WA584_13875 [Pyrinomonadaceae bacterium]